MTGSGLYLASINGTDLSSVIGLTNEQITQACGDQNTRLPDYLDQAPVWSCPSQGQDSSR
jgi:hypothetical protein